MQLNRFNFKVERCKPHVILFYQVNSKATLMFSGFDDDEILENLFWPDLPYVSDEHGSKSVV